jgi:hypothetical protein
MEIVHAENDFTLQSNSREAGLSNGNVGRRIWRRAGVRGTAATSIHRASFVADVAGEATLSCMVETSSITDYFL